MLIITPANLPLILQNGAEKILNGGSAIFADSINQILLHILGILLIHNFSDIDVKSHALVAKATPLCLCEMY